MAQVDPAPPPLRLLFIVPFSPRFDARHGGRVVAQLLFRLTERHRVAVIYLQRPGGPSIDPLLTERCELVEEVAITEGGPTESSWRHRLHVLAAPLTGLPSPAAPLRDRRFARVLVEVADRWHPEVIQVEHDNIAYVGSLLRDAGNPAVRVLTCHEPGPLASEDQARLTRGRRKLAHRLDAAVWRRYWSRNLPSFDAIVALTESDRGVIASAVDGPRLTSIGLGIDIPKEPHNARGKEGSGILFVGGYQHPPNTDAALRLIRSIMPAVRRSLPGMPLVLVGTSPGAELLQAAGPDDEITGTVPYVGPYVNDATLLALPIRMGGGMRVKLLEALAAGKPVVASRLAAAGLEVSDGVEIAFAETDREFADRIIELASDHDARTRMGAKARAWAISNLGWDSRVCEYERLYRSLLPPAAS